MTSQIVSPHLVSTREVGNATNPSLRSRGRGATNPAARVAIHLVLLVIAIGFLTPLVYIAINSFKTQEEIWSSSPSLLPRVWTLDNYAAVAESGRFADYFINSVVITIAAVLLTTAAAALAGYGFAKIPFPGRGILLAVILMTLTIPLAIFLVPMFLMENATGLLNTRLGLILPNIAVHLPFSILIMRSAFTSIPKEIEESAVMDGAGPLRQWFEIMLPMARNGVVLVIIMATYNIWGEYTLAKTLATNPPAMPLTVGLTLLKSETWQYGILAAVITLAVLPPIIVFVIFQKHIVSGITQGAVKG